MKTLSVANGDWAVDSRGRFDYVDGRPKLAQDVAEALLQDVYSDGSFGSALSAINQGTALDAVTAHKSLISNFVHEAMDRLMVKQGAEDATDDQAITSYRVTVDRMPGVALSYFFYLTVNTVAGDTVPVEPFVVQIEQAKDPSIEE